MDPLPPSWAVAADGASIESTKQTRNVTTRGMRAPWFDPDGGTLRLRHAPVKPSPAFAVVSVGETRRPSGQPRMPAFSTTFARLYESDERGPTRCVSSGEPPVVKGGRQPPRGVPSPAMRPVVLVALLAAGLLRQPQ